MNIETKTLENQICKKKSYYKPIPKDQQKKRGRKIKYDTPELNQEARKNQDLAAHRKQRQKIKLIKECYDKMKN